MPIPWIKLKIPFYARPGRKFLPFTGDTLFIGKRGSGKTVLAVRCAFEDFRSGVITNRTIDQDRFNALREARGLPRKTILKIEKPREFYDRHCWYRLLDEAQKFFPARKYKDADEVALNAVSEERPDDAWTAYTCQALRNLDVLVASFCDNIVLCRLVSVPFAGWLWPECVRPPQLCRHADAEPEEHERRDSVGDQDTFWRKLFGFGAIHKWRVIDPELVVKRRTLDESAQPEPGEAEDPAVLARGWAPFDRAIADCFDSGQKVVAPPPAEAPKPKASFASPRGGWKPAAAGGRPLL